MSFEQMWDLVKGRTLLHHHKGRNLYGLLLDILNLSLAGDIVECGVYRGGISALMVLVLQDKGAPKKVYMFDSFEGLPSPDPGKDLPYYKEGSMCGEFQEVADFMAATGLSEYEAIKGWFRDTLPGIVSLGRKICFLHVDCDLYESTKQCLDCLHDLVVPGGVMVFDDYFDLGGGEKKAVDELVSVTGEMVFAGPMEQVFIEKGRLVAHEDERHLIDPFGDGGVKVSLRKLAENRLYLKDLACKSFREGLLGVNGRPVQLKERIAQISGYHARVLDHLGIREEAPLKEDKSRVISVARFLVAEDPKNVVNPGTVSPSNQSHGRGLAVNVNVG